MTTESVDLRTGAAAAGRRTKSTPLEIDAAVAAAAASADVFAASSSPQRAGLLRARWPRPVRMATQVAGRVLFSGVPTGVAVCAVQHHGGPWPASTQPFSTSVGYAALDRFLRPVALQDAPAWLLDRKGVPC